MEEDSNKNLQTEQDQHRQQTQLNLSAQGSQR